MALKLVQRVGEGSGKVATGVVAIVPTHSNHGKRAGLIAVVQNSGGDPNVEFRFGDGPIEVSADE